MNSLYQTRFLVVLKVVFNRVQCEFTLVEIEILVNFRFIKAAELVQFQTHTHFPD